MPSSLQFQVSVLLTVYVISRGSGRHLLIEAWGHKWEKITPSFVAQHQVLMFCKYYYAHKYKFIFTVRLDIDSFCIYRSVETRLCTNCTATSRRLSSRLETNFCPGISNKDLSVRKWDTVKVRSLSLTWLDCHCVCVCVCVSEYYYYLHLSLLRGHKQALYMSGPCSLEFDLLLINQNLEVRGHSTHPKNLRFITVEDESKPINHFLHSLNKR